MILNIGVLGRDIISIQKILKRGQSSRHHFQILNDFISPLLGFLITFPVEISLFSMDNSF